VAEAIAAFYQNNKARERAGLAAVTSAVIPGITMLGSAPTFFKIPVSRALVKAVVTGQYPESTNVVERLLPPVEDVMNYSARGMKPLVSTRPTLFVLCANLYIYLSFRKCLSVSVSIGCR
jgi:hypothetical protein